MNYKEFGIYVGDKLIYIIVGLNSELITGFQIPILFLEKLSNTDIYLYLSNYYEDPRKIELFIINIKQFPDVFINNGYLGQIQNPNLQGKLQKSIKEAIL